MKKGNLKRGLKKTGKISTIVLFLLFLILVNLYAYFLKHGKTIEHFRYDFFNSFIENLKTGDLTSIIFIIQIVLILAIVIIFFISMRNKKNKPQQTKRKKNKKNKKLKVEKKKGETEIDALYRILRLKKELRTNDLAKAFNVNEDKVLEWARILEENNLVTTEYPTFSRPLIKIKEQKE